MLPRPIFILFSARDILSLNATKGFVKEEKKTLRTRTRINLRIGSKFACKELEPYS